MDRSLLSVQTRRVKHLQSLVVGSKGEVFSIKSNDEIIEWCFVSAPAFKENANIKLSSLHLLPSIQDPKKKHITTEETAGNV